MDKRCTFPEADSFHRCGSYAFNLHKRGIDQGTLCDVHHWQARVAELEAGIEAHKKERLPHMTNAQDRALWSLVKSK